MVAVYIELFVCCMSIQHIVERRPNKCVEAG